MDKSQRFCIIGAGPCGLVAAKVFREQGLEVDLIEREDDVGGNWHFGRPGSSVYASAHMISSKRMTQFSDFPMPKAFPPYPNHRQALQYLRDYAQHFQLYEAIRFNTAVERVEPAVGLPNTLWQVTLSDGATHAYRGVVVANGHHWKPRWPELPGAFSGEVLHAHDYKTPELLRGKRVLVVGGGNSGCDLAVEAAGHAASTLLSLRRGYHFLPKFLLGGPLDAGGERFDRLWLPLFLQRWITGLLVRIAVGRPERYGLPRPEHRLFETHPIVNSQLLYCIGHGEVQVRPAIGSAQGNLVRFADGREDEVDLILCATGYHTSFPFLDPSLVLDERGRPTLFLNAFHPQYDNLFVAGLIQPNGAIWPLAELQAQVMAAFVRAQDEDVQRAKWFCKLKAQARPDLGGGIHYDNSERHHLEVEFFAYRRQLRKLLSRLTLPTAGRVKHSGPAEAAQ